MSAPVVIVLAGGRSERFRATGGLHSKLGAKLAGKTVLEHTLAAVTSSGLHSFLEQSGQPGMGDSIAHAVRASWQQYPNLSGWLLLPADLPLIQGATLSALARAMCTHTVVAPLYHGQRGHPVGFAVGCGAALLALHGDRGAAAVLAREHYFSLAVADPGCVTDIDTVADLRSVEELMGVASADER